MHELTGELASFAPPRPEQQALFAALARRQADVDRFLGVMTGAVPLAESSRPGTCSGSWASAAWPRWPSGDAGRLPPGEAQLVTLGVDHDRVAVAQLAGEQAAGQLVADGLGDQAAQGAGAVGRVV